MLRSLYVVGLAVALAGGACIAVACGSDTSVDDAQATKQLPFDGGGGDSGGDSGGGGDAAKEQKLATFTCGGTSCVVGEHACCPVSGTFACFSLEAGGCPLVDAGADAAAVAPPPLLCATYNNCNQSEKCCWTADAGSKCQSSCSSGQRNLCTLGVDGCGESFSCDPFASPPLPDAGSCVFHD